MGGAEGMEEAASCLISHFLGGNFFFIFFAKPNTSLASVLRRLQMEGYVSTGPFFTKQTGFALVRLVALSACTSPSRLNEPAPSCSLRH